MLMVIQTGLAQVVGTKEGTALLSHSLLPAAPLRINVLPVEKILITPAPFTVLINTGVTSIPLLLLNSRHKDKRSNLVSETHK